MGMLILKYRQEILFVLLLVVAWLWFEKVKQFEYDQGFNKAQGLCVEEKLAAEKAANAALKQAVKDARKRHAIQSKALASKLAAERKRTGELNEKLKEYSATGAGDVACFDDAGLRLFNE